MPRYQKRDDRRRRPELLAALGACRKVLNAEMASMKAMGPMYCFALGVTAAIDALAAYMTGEPYYFYDKGTSGFSRPSPTQMGGPADGEPSG